MSKWEYLKTLFRLMRATRLPQYANLSPEESGQLANFLKSTGTGQKMTEILRAGVMTANADCAGARTSDEALRLSGYAAGYASAVATIDVLSGADSRSEEDQGDSPDLTTDLDWLYNPKPRKNH